MMPDLKPRVTHSTAWPRLRAQKSPRQLVPGRFDAMAGPRYRVIVRSRQLLLGLLGLLAVVLPATAEAARHHGFRHRHITSITVIADGEGSLLAVRFAGHPRARLIRSTDPIASYTVADIDNDGNLDILAASDRSGLLVWHNAGRGRFVLAAISPRQLTHRPAPAARRVAHVDDGPLAADERYDAAMPRAPTHSGSDPAAAVQSAASPFAPSTSRLPRPGRAPPSLFV